MSNLWHSTMAKATESVVTSTCAQGFAYALATLIPSHALPLSVKRGDNQEGEGG